MPCQCSAGCEKALKKVESARRFETEGLRRMLEEKGAIIRSQRKEIAGLRATLSACRCMGADPHSEGGQGLAMAGQVLALRRALQDPREGHDRERTDAERLAEERAELVAAVQRPKAENTMLARGDRYHNGPHAPPLHNSISAMQRKAQRRAAKAGSGGVAKRPGRKKGHKGVSHRRKSEGTVHHMPECYHGCGIGGLKVLKRTVK